MGIEINSGTLDEMAADGRRVDRQVTERRLLEKVGRRLIAEREADIRAGRAHRPVSDTHRRAIVAAVETEILAAEHRPA